MQILLDLWEVKVTERPVTDPYLGEFFNKMKQEFFELVT
jgi:hypothetical protein